MGKAAMLGRSINGGGARARARAGNVSDSKNLSSPRRLLFRQRWNKTLAVMKTFIAPLALLGILASTLPAADTAYRDGALEAARWIRASAAQADQGTVWPSDPRDAKSVNDTLYAGTPGVILFFLEGYRSTGDQSLLKDARAGADHLLAAFAQEKESGLYVGIAGMGFALNETFKATGDSKYRQGALRCTQLIGERAKKAGKGIEWDDTTDIIAGGAGIGLFLLYAARELKEPGFLDLAIADAQRLIELGQPEKNGVKWRMNASFARLMPNFSHGTAGIAYFLATLYQVTGRREFLDAALAGARYLQAIAKSDDDVCLIFHNEPDGKDLYYLGWCHGPVGTARLFYKLYQVTGVRAWMDWVRKSARGILKSGIPENQTPGFWNNVSQCCGSAGVAEFFLSLYRVTSDRAYLEFSKRVTANLLARGTRDSQGMRWIQAEHRVKPELLVAQTGYMQGAAGIGMLLLHLDGFERGKKALINFPDSPFD
jgi:lantibiotic modifying enzyme